MISLEDFVKESNHIEGISGVSPDNLKAHEELLALDKLTVKDVERFVSLVQPNAILRRPAGLNVRVGAHVAPPGGPAIESALEAILEVANGSLPGSQNDFTYSSDGIAYEIHQQYETLHPFSDGNGRSGRALWLWVREGNTGGGFLREWAAQTLARGRVGFYDMRDIYYRSLQVSHG